MGVLKPQHPGPARSLAARSLVGRAPACLVRLDDASVSAEHASIFWTGQSWELRDLASRNGTYVDGTRAEPGKRVALRSGAEIRFGTSAETWVLVDTSAPVASARRADGDGLRVAEHGLLVLPSEQDPRISVISGGLGGWLVEDGAGARPAVDQEVLEADGAWLLSVPPPSPEASVATTRRLVRLPMTLATVSLEFGVSRDEEHVELSLRHPEGVTPLQPRAHHYLLLTLARARLEAEDTADQVPAERGWIHAEELLDMLKLDAQHLAVLIYRARQQLAAAGVEDAGEVIERRFPARQVRLGTSRVAVRPS